LFISNIDYHGLILPSPAWFLGKIYSYEHYRWIDVTYLSDTLRISRGNKGTLFILKKIPSDEIKDDPTAVVAYAKNMKEAALLSKSLTDKVKLG
jgi:hypothetical protein